MDDLEAGDLWYFPAGHPHSLQGLSPNGTEFLLIFDDGHFSEESTFLLTDWMGKASLQVKTQLSALQLIIPTSAHVQVSASRKLPPTS